MKKLTKNGEGKTAKNEEENDDFFQALHITYKKFSFHT